MSSNSSITDDLKEAGSHAVQTVDSLFRAGRKVFSKSFEKGYDFLSNFQHSETESLVKPDAENFRAIIKLPSEILEELTAQILDRVKELTGGRLSESEEQRVKNLIREYFG